MFDPGFFAIGPRDAAIMDPQHRHFIECAWDALEASGHVPERFDGSIGVFAGCGMNTYMLNNLLTNRNLVDQIGMFLLRHTGNDKDFLTTAVSYKLDLRGPSVNVQTACSTSLVAVHLAVQSLLALECDLALAGGSTIEVPHRVGYTYEEGEMLSPDGVCRAFDARSEGTVLTSGVGVVALRRLADALEDGDPILAVIKGTAINNDGAAQGRVPRSERRRSRRRGQGGVGRRRTVGARTCSCSRRTVPGLRSAIRSRWPRSTEAYPDVHPGHRVLPASSRPSRTSATSTPPRASPASSR